MRAARSFADGESLATAAPRLGVSRTTAMRWAHAREAKGAEALGATGPEPRLDPPLVLLAPGRGDRRRGASGAPPRTDAAVPAHPRLGPGRQLVVPACSRASSARQGLRWAETSL
jgi:hypothetical protein